MSNTYLQSAQDLLVIDIKVPVASGSPLQALGPKAEANQIWTTEDVPGQAGYFWIVSAAKDGAAQELVIDIKVPVASGSPLQALVKKSEKNQWWRFEDVPGQAGYFWIVSAAKDSAGQELVVDTKAPVASGSPLQALVKKSEKNQWWTLTNIKIRLGFNQFAITGTGFAPGSTATGNATYSSSIGAVNGGPYTLSVDSLGTITAYDLPLDGLEFNTPGSLTVEVVDSSWALSAKDSVPVPASE